MKVQILGSSAGVPIPNPFCTCSACNAARVKGGKNVRTRTSVNLNLNSDLVNGALMNEGMKRVKYWIDLSPDIISQSIKENLCLDRLEYLLYTHHDGDHVHPEFFTFRFGLKNLPLLNVFGNEATKEKIENGIGKNFEKFNFKFHIIKPFESFQAGALQVVPLKATHLLDEGGAFNFVIQSDNKTLLCAWDTKWWREETWEALKLFRFDGVIMECTRSDQVDWELKGHLNLETFLEMKQRLDDMGCPNPGTVPEKVWINKPVEKNDLIGSPTRPDNDLGQGKVLLENGVLRNLV